MTERDAVRVLTYNVRSLRDDARAVARVIRSADPDVVCLQEVPRFLFARRKARRLARRARLQIVTGGRDSGATMVLARRGIRVVATRTVRLSKRRGLHQRGLAMAVLDLPAAGRTLVVSTHMSLDADERAIHLLEIVSELRRATIPVILAGDLNETPDGPVWHALAERYVDAWALAGTAAGFTFSAGHPRQRIDAIFVADLEPARASVQTGELASRASDHLALAVDCRTDDTRQTVAVAR
ncbi:MAG: endonuclease/exonuclease/phosphatase family protein [Mycobacteriales bacterium]|nr:endonuclease/exonuclease/phosphatase family protein [Frankia sp.]